jgi:simple sugar transport system ATP-binding protein
MSGEIRLEGRQAERLSTSERIGMGIRLVPEDRHEEGVVDDWPLDLNAAIGLQRLVPFASAAWVDRRARSRQALAIAERFQTKHGGLSAPIRSLSGGNQQRFVAGRAVAVSPKLLLAYQPARGLDIEATEAIYSALREEAARGTGSLVVSYDLDELLEHCDRIVVMCGGKLLEPLAGSERDRDVIGRLMVGAS